MARFAKFIGSTLGLSAAVSMAVSPAMAADLPMPVQPLSVEAFGKFNIEEGNAEHHRYRRYRRNRVDAGDVIAGVLILGTIAAVASAASNSNKRNRPRDVRYEDRDYQPREEQRRGDSRYNGERGIDSAVSMCVNSIERDVRVDRVDNVNRNADGWQVTGTIYNGETFACQINSRGEIENVSYGARYSAQASPSQVEDRQHSPDRYAAAWDRVERSEAQQAAPQQAQPRYEQAATTYGEARYTPEQASQQPAYPGGPVDGDIDETVQDQARTRIAQAADSSR